MPSFPVLRNLANNKHFTDSYSTHARGFRFTPTKDRDTGLRSPTFRAHPIPGQPPAADGQRTVPIASDYLSSPTTGSYFRHLLLRQISAHQFQFRDSNRVEFYKMRPGAGHIAFVENRFDGTFPDTDFAIDARFGIDVKLPTVFIKALGRTYNHAVRVLAIMTGLADDKGHWSLLWKEGLIANAIASGMPRPKASGFLSERESDIWLVIF
jgi:hypothetical protein